MYVQLTIIQLPHKPKNTKPKKGKICEPIPKWSTNNMKTQNVESRQENHELVKTESVEIKNKTYSTQVSCKLHTHHYLNWCSKKPDFATKIRGSAGKNPIWVFPDIWADMWSSWIERSTIWNAKVVSLNLMREVIGLEAVDSTPKSHSFLVKDIQLLHFTRRERERDRWIKIWIQNPSQGFQVCMTPAFSEMLLLFYFYLFLWPPSEMLILIFV